MNDIIKLKGVENYKIYNPMLVLSEDIYFDNRFCVLKTDMGDIAFSYYDLGVSPSVVIQNKILFLSFGQSYYVIDLAAKELLYQSYDSLTIIFEIIKHNSKSCVLFVGELCLLCFSLEGRLAWKNYYRYIIFDWEVTEDGMLVEFEDGDKMLVSLENGNGVPTTRTSCSHSRDL